MEKLASAVRKSLGRARDAAAAAADEAPDPSAGLAEDLIRYSGVTVSFLLQVLADVRSGALAPGKRLFVAIVDISSKVRKDACIELMAQKPDGSMLGTVPYVAGTVSFTNRQVMEKGRRNWTTEDVAEHVVLPATTRQALFYLDVIADQALIGAPYEGAFVSQARACVFGDLVGALEAYCAKKGVPPSEQFVWLDLFCANQPLLTGNDSALSASVVEQRHSFLAFGLHDAIQRFDERLVFFDSWKDPAPLKRAWCVWELLGSLMKSHGSSRQLRLVEDDNGDDNGDDDDDDDDDEDDEDGEEDGAAKGTGTGSGPGTGAGTSPVQAIFKPGQEQDFLEVLIDDPHKISQAMVDIDTRKAMCFKKQDKDMIDAAIEEQLENGFVTLNGVVLNNLRDVLKQITEAAIDPLGAGGERRYLEQEYAQVLSQAASFMLALGSFKKAQQYFQRSLKIYETELGKEHAFASRVRINVARSLMRRGRFEESAAMFATALASTQAQVATASEAEKERRRKEQAGALLGLGQDHLYLGDAAAALQDCEAARQLYCGLASVGPKHEFTADAVVGVGRALLVQGRHAEALAKAEEALAVYAQTVGARHPSAATALELKGNALVEQGKLKSARAALELALGVRKENMGQLHPAVARTSVHIAELACRQGRFADALKLCDEAEMLTKAELDAAHPDAVAVAVARGRALLGLKKKAAAAVQLEKARDALRPSLQLATALALLAEADARDPAELYRAALAVLDDVFGEAAAAEHPAALSIKAKLKKR